MKMLYLHYYVISKPHSMSLYENFVKVTKIIWLLDMHTYMLAMLTNPKLLLELYII